MQSNGLLNNRSIYRKNVPGNMQKKEWVQRIEQTHANDQSFVARLVEENKAPLVFAADVFRRRRYDVTISLEASQTGKAVLHVCIPPYASALEFTVRRNQTPESILQDMQSVSVNSVTIRGCGTVINTVCKVVEVAIHSGWFIEKNVLNTLTQTGADNIKQRNTTLLVVLRRGSSMDSI